MGKISTYAQVGSVAQTDLLLLETSSGTRTAPANLLATKAQLDAVEARIQTGGSTGSYTLPVATNTTLGGVKPVTKTTAMTQSVGVDSSGRLYTAPGSGQSYTLPVATNATLGGVKPVTKTSDMTQNVGVDSSGRLYTAPGSGQTYTLPTASNTTLGGVKPVTKTAAMTQSVGVDSSGRLYTTPSSGDVAVSQTVTSGVEIAKVNGTSIYLPDGRSERY